jgi:hypothetical protein
LTRPRECDRIEIPKGKEDKKMEYKPYCPHCAIELDIDDHYDMYEDGDTIIVKAIGHCYKCGKRFRWEDVYTLCTFQDLEEDE